MPEQHSINSYLIPALLSASPLLLPYLSFILSGQIITHSRTSSSFFFNLLFVAYYFKVLPEISVYAHNSLTACVWGRGNKKKGKDKGKICPGCTCIHLECLHIFGCKYVYKKKNPLPFSEPDPEASKQAFRKVH